MMDRLTVMGCLEGLTQDDWEQWYSDSEVQETAKAALSLLKEQEPVPVPEDKINKCECGKTVCRYWHPKFCGFCGRELLWY